MLKSVGCVGGFSLACGIADLLDLPTKPIGGLAYLIGATFLGMLLGCIADGVRR